MYYFYFEYMSTKMCQLLSYRTLISFEIVVYAGDQQCFYTAKGVDLPGLWVYFFLNLDGKFRKEPWALRCSVEQVP